MLGFNLMGTLASKSTGRLCLIICSNHLKFVYGIAGPIVGTPQHRACCLGSRLLLKTFKVNNFTHCVCVCLGSP